MAETTEKIIVNEGAEPVAEPAPEKKYHFRLLGAPDVFLMLKIVKCIGIKEFVGALQGDSLKEMVSTLTDKGAADPDDLDSTYMMGALAGIIEIADVIIGNLPKCEKEIYQLLAQTSDLTVDEIKAEGNAVMFLEMIIDFLKKDEFPDFFKVVSKLFK